MALKKINQKYRFLLKICLWMPKARRMIFFSDVTPRAWEQFLTF